MQIPHSFFARTATECGFDLPEPGQYGVAMVFLPRDAKSRRFCERVFERIVREEGQKVLGWRTVPTDNSMIGTTAKATEPVFRQCFIGRNRRIADDQAFERRLFIIRKRAYLEVRNAGEPGTHFWYVASLSCRTIGYKGMLMPAQVDQYFPDLRAPDMESASGAGAFAVFDQHVSELGARPSVPLPGAQRRDQHPARQHQLDARAPGDVREPAAGRPERDQEDPPDHQSERLGLGDVRQLPGTSRPQRAQSAARDDDDDSGAVGRAREHERRTQGVLRISLLPDGTVGRPGVGRLHQWLQIGACLDRNGLRPSRFYVTHDDLVVMASEAGVLDIAPERVKQKGRLQPGRMFLIDTEQGRIIGDDEIKDSVCRVEPYREWINRYMVDLGALPDAPVFAVPDHDTMLQRQQAFGYTFEELRVLMVPMARDGVEAIGSMGTDTPLAVLSDRPQLLYNYFKQLFAQVTNPPVDCIREEIIFSTETTIGAERNLLTPEPRSCQLIELKSPILTNEEFAKLKYLNHPAFSSVTLPILFKARRFSRDGTSLGRPF
jgi:hypothetical protein